MFFSRVIIDSSPLSQIKLLKILQSDLYAMHQLIWKLFPVDPQKKRDFLYRQEFEKEQLASSSARRGMPLFYILSEREPVPTGDLLSVETKKYAPKLKAGMRLGFDVRVNPVIARGVEGKKNSSKHDIMMDAKKKAKEQGLKNALAVEQFMNTAAVEWLAEKSKKAGFSLSDEAAVEVSGYQQERLRKRGGKEIRFSSVDISGSLTVTEPELFRKILFTGIGHSRSFGCGMMMIRRI
jgi:CRISPR system Cascade subunit CasE